MSTGARGIPVGVARLTTADAVAFRDLRLEGLRAHPEAFGASWDDEAAQSGAQFAAHLERAAVFGARLDDDVRLDGVVGLHLSEATKVKHKAALWGMYVRPEARRSGVGAALIDAAIAHAAAVEQINLTVAAANASAFRFYRAAGFRQYGLERRALKVGDRYYDEALMSLALPRR